MEFQQLVALAPWTAIFQICNLLLLAAGVKHFLFKPVQNVVQKRKEQVEDTYANAEKAEGEALAMREECEKRLAGAKDEASDIVKTATVRASARTEEMMTAARAEVAAILMRFCQDVARLDG